MMNSVMVICYVLIGFGMYHLVCGNVIGISINNFSETFRDKEALFGTAIGRDGIEGFLVKADPIDACKPIKERPLPSSIFNESDFTNASLNMFVIIRRGKCNFDNKVMNAQRAKYDAAIVYNVGSDYLITMTAGHDKIAQEIVIPSVFVGEKAGYFLENFYLYDEVSSPRIEIYRNFSLALDDIIVPFCAAAGAVLLCLLAYKTFRFFHHQVQVSRSRLSRERLRQLPIKRYCKGDDCDMCAICLDDYKEGACLRVLPCKHAYHCKCIDPWLTRAKRVCPLCKRRVLSQDDSSDEDYRERSNLLDDAVAASPNAPRYGTGFSRINPFQRYANSASSSETDSVITEVDEEQVSVVIEHIISASPLPDTSGFSPASSFEINPSPETQNDEEEEHFLLDDQHASPEASRTSEADNSELMGAEPELNVGQSDSEEKPSAATSTVV